MAPEKRFMGLSRVFHGIFMKLHLVVVSSPVISNGNRTKWSPILSVIIRVITKLDDHAVRV